MSKSKYKTGADFWRDIARRNGLEEALGIACRYLDVQLQTENPDERVFCRELFEAAHFDMLRWPSLATAVYPHAYEHANACGEAAMYHASRMRNIACAQAIDEAIYKSCYKPNHYNLEVAMWRVALEYGFERTGMVLAHDMRQRSYDGRFSPSNKRWAEGIEIPMKAFDQACPQAHPILLDGFAEHLRAACAAQELDHHERPNKPRKSNRNRGDAR